MFRSNTPTGKKKITIEATTPFNLINVDAKLNMATKWHPSENENGPVETNILVDTNDAPDLIQKLLLYPGVLTVNHHITKRGELYYNSVEHVQLNTAFRPY